MMTAKPREKRPHGGATLKRKLILTVAFVVAFFIGIATDASGKTKTVTTAAKTVGSEAKSNVVALDPKTGNIIIARFRLPKTVGLP